MSGAINSNGFVSSVNVQSQFGASANIPELIMAVQIERSNVIENQVKDQIGDMQKRNEWLKDANAALAAIRTARPSDTNGKVSFTDVTFVDGQGKGQNAVAWLNSQGVNTGLDTVAAQEAIDAKAAVDAKAATNFSGTQEYPTFTDQQGNTVSTQQWAMDKGYTGFDAYTGDSIGFKSEMTSLSGKIGETVEANKLDQGEFDAMINNLKSSIDTVNSQSQMDMVRLQGLMDKRNQAFDMLTNNLSKFSKSMDSVIGNMR